MAMFRCVGGNAKIKTGNFKPLLNGETITFELGFRPTLVYIYTDVTRTGKTSGDYFRKTYSVVDGIGDYNWQEGQTPIAQPNATTQKLVITDTGFTYTQVGNDGSNLYADLWHYIGVKY